METMNIITERLNSANIAVKADNAGEYNIRANVNVYGDKVSSVDGGSVYRASDKVMVASFNMMPGMNPSMTPGAESEPNITITYMGGDITKQCEINQVVNDFIAKVKENPASYTNL